MDCRRCFAGVAALLSLAALLLLLPVRHLVASRVAAEVADTRERVLRTPSAADVTLRLSLFALHVTNPLDVISGHSKPALQQRGPYTYERRVVRTPVPGAAGEDDGVFTYYESEEYTFLPSESCESTDTLPKHQVANLGFWGAAAAAPKYGFTGRLLMDLLTSEYTTRDLVFELRSARDLAFGFTSPLLRSIDRLHSGVQTYVAGITTRVSANTTGGVAESLGECRVRLRPGDDGSGFAGELLEWHGDARGLCCVAEHCPPDAPVPPWSPPSSVAGSSSDGLFFPPSLAAGDSVLKWVAEGMRPMALVSAAQPSLQPSLTSLRTLRFELDMAQFDPAGAGQGFDLLGAPGVLTNQSKCTFGTPVFSTLPHFLHAPSLAGDVDGFSPNSSLHTSFAEVDPTTGVAVRGAQRAQVGISTGPIVVPGEGTWLPRMRKMQVFPIGWFELTGEASLEAQRKLRIAAIAPDAAAATMAAFAIGAAAAAAVLLAPPVAGQDVT